jgi:hypothetical protein
MTRLKDQTDDLDRNGAISSVVSVGNAVVWNTSMLVITANILFWNCISSGVDTIGSSLEECRSCHLLSHSDKAMERSCGWMSPGCAG